MQTTQLKESSSSESLANCLKALKHSLNKKNSLGALIQEWQSIAGKTLASNCNPISLNRGILVIGASHPQWRQALIYNRVQLISSLKKAGYKIKDIRIQQHYPQPPKDKLNEQSVREKHPSRIDVHGMAACDVCGSPCPAGELTLWKKCVFCRRQEFS